MEMEATKTQLKNETGRLLEAAGREPVVVTHHGFKSHVLMSYERYMELMALEAEKKRPATVLETPEQG